MDKISASQAAKLLGILSKDLDILEKKGIVNSSINSEGEHLYSLEEIDRIKSHHGPTLVDEAAQVDTQIQQEVFTSVSALVNLRKKVAMVGAATFLGIVLLFLTFSGLFYFYPLQTSDFFGYFYRINLEKQKISLSTQEEGNVLAATTTAAGVVPVETSIIADIIRPIATASLVAVKAIDSQKYTQIVTNPIEPIVVNGAPGSPGPAGINGVDGADGATGAQGPAGSAGTNGSNGTNGTSVADVLTTVGSIIIRDGTNTTVPLTVGSNGQVLTVSGGVPAWQDSSTTNFSGTLAGDVTGTQGATVLKNTGTAGTYGSATNVPVFTTDAQGRVTGVTNTAISELTVSNFGSANISQWTNNSGYLTSESDTLASVTGRGATTATALTLSSLSNAITAGTLTATGGTINGTTIGATTPAMGVFTTINGLTITNNGSNTLNIAAGKTLTASNSLTFTGTDGTSFAFPSTSDDVVGRTVSQTLTNKTIAAGSNTISGLTVSNFGSANISQWTNNSGYLTAPVANASLTNSSLTVSAGTGLSGGGSVSLGGTTTLSLPNIGTSGTYGSATNIPVITTDAQGRVTGVTNTGISGLTASNLTAGDYSSVLTSGTYGITVSNFSGSLAGDVTGTQGSTTVGKINGSTLGTTTATSGNLLIANGLTWSTQPLSGDATITSGGVLTLKNTGTAGTYGSATNIPVVTTDAQGRVTGVTNTAISGLTVSNFGSANISQWTNNSGYLTSESDTLAAVTGRGASTSTAVTLNGGVTTTTSTALSLDSGTTGNVNLGNGSNAKTLTIGNTTGATAVNVNSGTGNINFTVGPTSSSGKVQIGNSATATPDLLILDNGTADPTGVNGGMYYNTTSGKFRCYENSVWINCTTGSGTGSDLQHAASYDTNEALTNIPSSTQVVLGTVSVTPSTATGDVYVTGFAEVRSSNGTDQPFTLVIETTNNCTGTTVGNASVTYTITSAASTTVHLGNIRVSGIAVDPGSSAQPYSLCASVSAGDTDVLNWGIEALVIDTGADLAEIYTTNDASIEAGDVVSLDPTLQAGMKKSQKAYDQSVLGIVSTKPGLIIGSVDNEGINALPVALSGRVPVKISTENGKITAGDYLTTSSIPGVAMKSTKAGAIIGTAMMSFDSEGVGQILVFVKNGSSAEAIEVVAKPAQINITEQLTKIISDLFNKSLEFFGSIIFHSDVVFLGRPVFNKDTAGHALIKQGDGEVSIEFSHEYARQPVVSISVMLTGETKQEEIPEFAVFDLSTKGFKIKLSRTAPVDMNFSWIALAGNEVNISTSVPATPAASAEPTPEISPSPTATESADIITPE